MNTSTLHESDFYGWTQQQANLIRSGKTADLDMNNILAEISRLGSSKTQELEGQITVLLAHLLKWKYQVESHTKLWAGSIKDQQKIVANIIRKNPSLKSDLPKLVVQAYQSVLFMAEHESSIAKYNFPPQCPWSIDEALGFMATID